MVIATNPKCHEPFTDRTVRLHEESAPSKPAPSPPAKPTEFDADAALRSLVERAEQGDRSVLNELRERLTASPEIWRTYGDLALQAEGALVTLAAGKNLFLAETMIQKLAAMRTELAGPVCSPLEKLLAARIASCWLQAAYYDALIAQNRNLTPGQSTQILRQQNAAHCRYLSALKALAVVRKLLKPSTSTLEMLQRPVAETTGSGAPRSRGGLPMEGMAVVN